MWRCLCGGACPVEHDGTGSVSLSQSALPDGQSEVFSTRMTVGGALTTESRRIWAMARMRSAWGASWIMRMTGTVSPS